MAAGQEAELLDSETLAEMVDNDITPIATERRIQWICDRFPRDDYDE